MPRLTPHDLIAGMTAMIHTTSISQRLEADAETALDTLAYSSLFEHMVRAADHQELPSTWWQWRSIWCTHEALSAKICDELSEEDNDTIAFERVESEDYYRRQYEGCHDAYSVRYACLVLISLTHYVEKLRMRAELSESSEDTTRVSGD